MRPIDYPYDRQHVFDVWQRFCERMGDYQASYDIDPVILESWRRCVALFDNTSRLQNSHLRRRQLGQKLREYADLISVALPYLEDIHQFTAGSPLLVFLADSSGVVLAVDGDSTVVSTVQRAGLGVGESWSEEHIGTNAVGLALQVAMPTQVVGAEHYFQIYHDYADTAAPVHDENGDIIGCIGTLTHADQAHASHLALVMAASRAITTQLQSDLMLEQANHRLRQLDTILESVADGVLTWDTAGTVDHINSMACQILGVRRSAFLGQPVAAIMNLVPHLQAAINHQQELSNVETTLQIDDRIVKCMMSIRTIHRQPDGIIGGIAMLQPLSQVRSLINQQTSSQAALTFDDFQSESVSMRQTLHQAQVAARGSAPVLLLGEGGVGKTALAQAIHNASPRANKPLIVVNCAAIPNELMLNELLGVEGYGEESGRPSKFELADGGTLLLDQIDHLSLEAQSALQQVINSRYLMRLHATRATPVNVRVIATTSIDIERQVENESFLAQLYYRFSVFILQLPPLRERCDDIPTLIDQFLKRNATGKYLCRLDDEALRVLEQYPWPGNVRELESVIERAVLHCDDTTIHVTDLPQSVRTGRLLKPTSLIPQSVISLEEAECEAIIRAGWAHQGTITAMAESLEIDRTTLWRKMKRYGIDASDFK